MLSNSSIGHISSSWRWMERLVISFRIGSLIGLPICLLLDVYKGPKYNLTSSHGQHLYQNNGSMLIKLLMIIH